MKQSKERRDNGRLRAISGTDKVQNRARRVAKQNKERRNGGRLRVISGTGRERNRGEGG